MQLHSKLTKKNQNLFQAKYPSVSNTYIPEIFERFERLKGVIDNRDIFSYRNESSLMAAIKPTKREKVKVFNGQRKNNNNVCELRSDRIDKVYELLRYTYDMKLTEEDMSDIVDGYGTMVKTNYTTKDIFSFDDLATLKDAIVKARNEGVETQITTIPEVSDKSKLLYADDDVLVYDVKSFEDSEMLCHNVGVSASWCISYKGNDTHWNSYHERNGISFVFVLYRKGGEKFALAMKDDGASIETYNVSDNVVSTYNIVRNLPQIVDPIKNAGYKGFRSSAEYDVTKLKTSDHPEMVAANCPIDYFYEVSENCNGSIGGGSGSFVSRIDEDGNYLDMDVHGTFGMKIG